MAKVAVERAGAIQVPKKCKRCGETKPPEGFYRHAMMADGLLSFCKQCTKKRVSDHREANLERIREYDRNRPNVGERTKLLGARNVEFRQAHLARVAVHNAVARKKLFKAPCEVCGAAMVHGHHDDYAKPLDVRWLCPRHHRQHHVEHGPGLNAKGPF